MDEMEQEHHELDRLESIITRHEGFIFTMRSWLLAIIGGLLAAYYTDNISMSKPLLGGALLAIVVLFLVVELKHVNLIEALVERGTDLDALILKARRDGTQAGWYDGPKVSIAAQDGANRRLPRGGMTRTLNLPFYAVVGLVVLGTTLSLPGKRPAAPLVAPAAQPAR